MKSITATSCGIAFKIWILALIINTIGGSYMLAGIKADFFLYAMLGGFFGAIFSFPVFLIVWKTLYHLFKKEYEHTEVFSALLVTSVALATLAYGAFSLIFPMGSDGLSLLLLAIVSGFTAVALCYGNIKRYCTKRKEWELDIEHIGSAKKNYNC